MLNWFSVTHKGKKQPDDTETQREDVASRCSSRRDCNAMEKQRPWKLLFDRCDRKIPIDNVTTSTLLEINARGLHPNFIAEKRADWKKEYFIMRDEFDPMVLAEDVGDQIPNSYCLLRYTPFLVPTSEIGILQYLDHYSYMQLPIFIFLISVLQIAVYIYNCIRTNGFNAHYSCLHPSPLEYNPCRRKEVWRYVTYMFVHRDASHVIFNVLWQLLLGIPLELIHSWWQVGLVYMAGVLLGSLLVSVLYPNEYIIGSSAGGYALIGAHLANVIVNFEEMECRFFELALLMLLASLELGINLVHSNCCKLQTNTSVSCKGHIGGALAGLLVGVVILQNLKVHPWETTMGWIMLYIYILLAMIAVFRNIFCEFYCPEQKI